MNIVEKFTKITNYDILQYFVDCDFFIKNHLPNITAYYKGNSSASNLSFKEVFRLYNEALKIDSIISSLSSSLSLTTEFWDLLEDISSIRTKLETVLNLAKWMRSSYVYGYENQSKFRYILKQNQTLENLSYNLGSNDPNQDWLEIALTNGVSEVDYTKQGGNKLLLNKTDNSQLNISSVVDIMVGDNILGKDIQAYIEFIDDDLVSLNTVDTMEQSADICLRTTKGSVPEFPNLGISKVFVGTTVSAIRFASLNREVVNNFKTDDSFKSVQMIDNGVNQDVAFYDFRIESRLNTTVNKTL